MSTLVVTTKYCLWQPPPEVHLKCNIDVVTFTTKQKVSMRACLTGAANNFVTTIITFCDAVMTPLEGKLLGFLHGINWVATM